MSKYEYRPYDVECPTCKQPPHSACRTRVTGRVTDLHTPRIDKSLGVVKS